MRELRRRIVKCVERLHKPAPETLYRLLNTRRDCVFVLGVLPAENYDRRHLGAVNITGLAKHDCRTGRAVGFFFTPGADGKVTPDTVYLEEPWAPDPELDQVLATANPFRPLRRRKTFGYYAVDG